MWRDVHFTFGKDVPLIDSKESNDTFRAMLLSSILFFKNKFKQYGEVVICCDSNKGYWRKDHYFHYKFDRKEKKEASKIDHNIVFKFMQSFLQELRDNFTFYVLETDRAEADDIIGVLCKWSQTNDLIESMFDSEPKPIMIVSEDHDFYKLQKYKNVKQFGHRKCAMLVPDMPLDKFLIKNIVSGELGDYIPNILSPDNSLINKIRQKPVTKQILEKFYAHGIDACENDDQRRRYLLNQTLVDFDFIPEEISNKIVSDYTSYDKKGNYTKILNYLIKHRCGSKLISDISGFTS